MAGKAIVIYSGGFDSTTLLYHLRSEGWEVKALSIDYGQRHRNRELTAAESVCDRLGVERRILDLRSLVDFFGNNSLTDLSIAVPEGPYGEATNSPHDRAKSEHDPPVCGDRLGGKP